MGNQCSTKCQSEIQNEQEILEQQPSLVSLKAKLKSKMDTTHDLSQFSNLQIFMPHAYNTTPNRRQMLQQQPFVRIPTSDSSFQKELSNSPKLRQNPSSTNFYSNKAEQHIPKSRKKQFDELLKDNIKVASSQSPRKRKKSQLGQQQVERPKSPKKSDKKDKESKRYRKYSDQPLSISQRQMSPSKSSPKKSPRKISNHRNNSINNLLSNQIQLQQQQQQQQQLQQQQQPTQQQKQNEYYEIESPLKRQNKSASRISYQQPASPTPILKRKDSDIESPKKKVRFQDGKKLLRRGKSSMNY